MLLDMLTADAAAKHRHEYSPPHHAPSPSKNGSFFSEMPLSVLGSLLRKPGASPAPASAAAPAVEPPSEVVDAAQPQTSPMKVESDAPLTSPAPSRPASSSSILSAEDKPKKRPPRPKTIYNLAQPPPSSHPKKLHIRPKVLLQLHQVIASQRPKPVYEVIPFSILAPVSTRRLARTFRSREKLGPHDLLIVRAEEYRTKDDEEKSDDERWGARDVIGVICPGKKEGDNSIKTEVLMDDGSNWEVTKTPNGGYDFSHTDEHGLTLKSRWVPKPLHIRRQSTMSSSSAALPTAADDRKFTFSTISANTRRHPIIASMTRERIEVLDSYTMPTATSPPTPGLSSTFPTPATTPTADMASFIDSPSERLPVKTDDALRRFIVVSGIWVAFSENWSPAYSLSKAICPSPLATSAALRPSQPGRTVSMPAIDSPRSASPASTGEENRRSIPRIIRTSTQLLHRNASFSSPAPSPVTEKPSPFSTPVKTRSRRSNSTGNAELPSKTENRRKRFGLALEDEPLPETDEERQIRRSAELLRIKELAVPSPAAPSPTQASSLTPIVSIEPPPPSDRSPSPASSDPRAKKTRSAYNPVTTAGLWDSGVIDGPGLKTRPTSMVVVNEKKNKKKKKAKRKEERSKSKEKKETKEKEARRKSESFRQLLSGMFRREKGAPKLQE